MNALPMVSRIIASNFPFSANLPSAYSLQFYVIAFYFFLITVLVLLFAVHVLLDTVKRWREAESFPIETSKAKFERFSLNQRLQHIVLIVTFTICAVTGFALRYFDSWGAFVIYFLGGLEARRIVHIVSGFTMGGLAIYHMIYYGRTFFTTHKRRVEIMFTKKDLSNLIANIKYLLNLAKEKPKFGRYNYIQKLDYWGVVWGIVIFGASGIALLFFRSPFGVGIGAPEPYLLVALLFHEREAVLAVLTLLVLHFYYSHLNADVFPMDRVWITGSVPEEIMRSEHPLELEGIKKGKVEPPLPPVPWQSIFLTSLILLFITVMILSYSYARGLI
jgi:cytochrome b subunit of formate dehydrogenase